VNVSSQALLPTPRPATHHPTLDISAAETLRRGPANQLPSHLSAVLGLSQGGNAVEVKQAVKRDAENVHVFNVCVGSKHDIVLINVDEHSHQSKAYLTSAKGTLRKAVAYSAGEPPVERSVKDAAADFARELALWSGP
jgi:hypothetical protein